MSKKRKRNGNTDEKKEKTINGLTPAKDASYDASVTITEPRSTTDAFSNPVARLGYGTQNLMEATEYPNRRIGEDYALMNSLWRGNWIVQKVVATIPEDVTKKWFKVTSKVSQEKIDKIERLQRVTKLRKAIVDGMCWGRLYGGAAGLILIKGDNDLEKPLELDRIMPDSFKGLYIVDRWSGITPSLELVSDINNPDFGYPMYYEIRNESGLFMFKVHHSRIIRFEGRQLPWIERVASSHWGQSEVEAIYDEIVKRDSVSNNIASLTFRANTDVYEKDNLDQILGISSGKAQEMFWNTLQAQSAIQSNLGTRVINKGDAWHQFQFNFAGLSDVYEMILMDVAGASNIPLTRMFGRKGSNGLNSTGDADLTIYSDYIDQRKEADFRPIIEKLLPIMALSAWGEIPNDLDFTYESFRTPTEKEKAEIAERKTASILEVYKAGLIDKAGALQELKSLEKGTGMYDNITDEMIDEGRGVYVYDQQMNDPIMGIINTPYIDDSEEIEGLEGIYTTGQETEQQKANTAQETSI